MQPNQTPPNGWQRKRIADLFDVRASGDIDWSRWSSEQDATHPNPVYANGRADSGLHGYASYAVEKGDAVTLTARGTLGELGYAFFRSTSFTPIGRLLVLRSKGEVDARYFASYINGRVRFAQENTGVAQLTAPQVTRYQIDLPPLSEQHAIATALSDVDALIAGLEKLFAKKRDLKQAAMQQLLTSQTRLPGFSGEWSVKKLGEICEISMGRTPSRLNPAFWGAGHVWLSIADLHGKVLSSSKEQITPLGASSMRVIPKGTLLMSFKLSIGRLCFAGCDLYTNEAICGFNNLLANSDYLYYALSRTDFSLYGKQAVKGYTLNKKSLALVEVALPSDEEQAAIANVLSSMDAELSDLEIRLTKTRDLKQGMMQELLTGRTRLV
jgi:type I restriction enzyme S subunit